MKGAAHGRQSSESTTKREPRMHSDLGRCVFVTLSGVFCIVGTLVDVGVTGTFVADTAGGALDSERP